MGGLSFLAPLYLLGALAVVVPILVHLFRRRTEHVVEFPAVRLIAASPTVAAHFLIALATWLLAVVLMLKLTPADEIRLIRAGNTAAAVWGGGTVIAMAIPIAAAMKYSGTTAEVIARSHAPPTEPNSRPSTPACRAPRARAAWPTSAAPSPTAAAARSTAARASGRRAAAAAACPASAAPINAVGTGALSAVLDNAPTYLNFLQIAYGPGGAPLNLEIEISRGRG